MKYTIAELGIEVNPKYDLAIRRMKDYQSEFGGTHIRINIEYDNRIELPPYKEITPFQSSFYWVRFDNGDFGAFRTLINSSYIIFYVRWNESAAEAVVKIADVTPWGGVENEIREFSYLGEIMHILLPFHNRLVLHSSALILENNGVAFSAPSGTGKSTHAESWKRLFPECVAINDDTPIVFNNGGDLRIYGSPWSGKTEINANISAPLKAVVCLEQARENRIERISPVASVPFLLHEVKYTPLKEREERKISVLTDVISNAKIYKFGCRPDDEAAVMCKEKIWKEM